MIILTRPEIEALIDYPRAAEAIEAAYRAVSAGKVTLPPVGHIEFPDARGDCHIKYGHIDGDEVFVIKVATGFEGNAAQGLPTGNGMSMVLSAQTGEVIALLQDEMHMTDIRTAIGGAIASNLLSRRDASRALIVGTGIQARRQVEAMTRLIERPLTFEIWGRSAERTDQAVAALSGAGISVAAARDLEAACRTADIIVTTTPARTPLIHSDWIRTGTHITAVGADAPGKQELESALVARADRLVADLAAQCLDHGEFAIPAKAGLIAPEQVVDLGAVLTDPTLGRRSDAEVTIADLTGLAVQDIAMAKAVLAARAAL